MLQSQPIIAEWLFFPVQLEFSFVREIHQQLPLKVNLYAWNDGCFAPLWMYHGTLMNTTAEKATWAGYNPGKG